MHSPPPSLLLCCAAALLCIPTALPAQDVPAFRIEAGKGFEAKDTLHCGPEAAADAAACLDGLKWSCGTFPVQTEKAELGRGDLLVRFPSPVPSGDAVNDRVAMEWYAVRNGRGEMKKAPALVIVHESGRGMIAGRLFARGLHLCGFHTFLVHLPGYGARTCGLTDDIKRIFPALRQSVADVRRARDAVAALPCVDASLVGLQGTSLGGFVVATVSGLDRGYQKAFILLAGGQLSDVLLKGQKDAAEMRRRLTEAGVSEEQICALSRGVEPLRLAHRVDAAGTWLFSGRFDEVVPPPCSQAFAQAARLDTTHHLVLPAGHYTAAVFMPAVLQQISDHMLGRPPKLQIVPPATAPANP
ncbi:MAG: hypothetical protein KA004_08350 [Verrucomicrobiales bacterium]|nr:hypothetical protein [Verrucomicrobiales bacterium]